MQLVDKTSALYRAARTARRWFREMYSGAAWRLKGRPPPAPSHIKRSFLKELAKRHRIQVLVESGTYQGDTLRALCRHFDMLHSIELSDELYRQAVTRFAGNAKVCLWQGDSGEVLAEIVERINAPTLFWLDGHYSGGKTAHGQEVTPIRRELQQIAGAKLLSSHVIVVDDARLFNGSNGYPTMEELQRLANGLGLTEFQIVTDLIIIRAV